MTKDLLAAARYAQALFELANAMGKDEAVEAELDSLAEALAKSPEIERFLANPALKAGEQAGFFEKLYGRTDPQVKKLLQDFFGVLFAKRRFYLTREIASSFKKIADLSQGQGTAELVSATPLKAEEQARIVERLERLAKKKITVTTVVEPSLIGGVVVRMDNKVIDGSVREGIRRIKKELIKAQSI